jgi:NADPH:quinone reductase-like Zn-dependent oxidoreductase
MLQKEATIRVDGLMKAMVNQEYGSPDKLELQEIVLPVVKDDELLVKVQAASVNWLDWHFLTGTPFLARLMSGLLKPKHNVLGVDVAGRVESVGAGVKEFQPGDDVFGSTDRSLLPAERSSGSAPLSGRRTRSG